MTSFHFVTVVWGKDYTHTYLKLSLPTQLAPGNLPAFADSPDCVYKVYTTSADSLLICSDPCFAEASRHVRTQIIEVAATSEKLTFASMIAIYQRAIEETNAAGAALVGLGPDMLFSNGCFATLRRLRNQGKRLILTASLRATLETFPAALQQAVTPAQNGAVSIPPRLLMQLTFDHLHPVSQSLFWNNPNFSANPTQLYWWQHRAMPRALRVHGFFIHPLLVDAEHKGSIPTGTIDDDYVHIACPDPKTHHIVTDSDELACVELSQSSHLAEFEGTDPAKIDSVICWCLEKCTDTHRQFARHAILLHEGPLPESFQDEKGNIHQIVSTILERCEVFRQKERKFEVNSPWLRWIGWLREQRWQGRAFLNRFESKNQFTHICQLDACAPCDLVTVRGFIMGESEIRTQLQFRGHPFQEKILRPGYFYWTVPAPLSCGSLLRITTPELPNQNFVRVTAITTWRTLLHHLRHDYTTDRADPIWLEWEGLQPDHILDGPATLQVIPYWGVTDVVLEVEHIEAIATFGSSSGQVPSGKRSFVVLLLNPARPQDPVNVNLPERYRLISVVCRQKLAWWIAKEIIQTLHTIVSAIFTQAGRRRWLGLGKQSAK